MDVDLEIEIFDSSCKTALALDDTVSVNELIEYIQQTFQEKFNGVDIQKLQIRIGGTDEMVIPSQKSLNEILRGQKKAKLFLLKNQIANLGGPPIPNQNSLQIHQSMPQNQNLNRQNPMEQQGTLTRNQNQPQNPIPQNQLQNSQFGRIINVNVKSGMQQIQVQLDDSVTIRDVIQNFQENMNIDLQSYHLYYGLQNLSLLNQNLTLKQLGMQNQSYLEWKHISQINQNQLNQQTNYNQRVQQPPMVMQSNIQGQNLPGQTQYNPQFNGQQANMPFQQQQFLYQQQQQQQQQLLFQQQQQQQQQQQFQTQQQQQQQYNQINTTNQQQGYQGQPGQQQVNTTQTSPIQQVQKPGRQIQMINCIFNYFFNIFLFKTIILQNQEFCILYNLLFVNQKYNQENQSKSKKCALNVSFEILDGNIKRQFSTITNTNNTLSELLDAVYQYLGISKEVASIDLWIGPTPFGGPKLLLSLEQLQMTKDNQTFTVKVRWIGG